MLMQSCHKTRTLFGFKIILLKGSDPLQIVTSV